MIKFDWRVLNSSHRRRVSEPILDWDIRMGDLYALDFDGVLCDSCGESSLSAVKVIYLFTCKLIACFASHYSIHCPLLPLFFEILLVLQAAKVRWPSLFNGVDSSLEDWIVDQMHVVKFIFFFFPL